MGSKNAGQQTVTQRTEIPPQFQNALNSILGESLNLGGMNSRQQITGYRNVNSGYGGSYREPIYGTVESNPASIVPGLSNQTQQGIDLLQQPLDPQAVNLLRGTAAGEFQGANPFTSPVNSGGMNQFAGQMNPLANVQNRFAGQRNSVTGQTGIDVVSDAIAQRAKLAVGDRFSQAGRTGSPGEAISLAGTISRELAPYAFGANESALQRDFSAEENRIGRMTGADENLLQRGFAAGENRLSRMTGAGESALDRLFASNQNAANRGFQSFENERGRQLSAIAPLLGLNQQQAQNFLSAGGILEQQQQQEMLEPFTRLNLISDPIIRAMGGAGGTTSTTQPINRNIGAGILGGAATGLGAAGALGSAGMFGSGAALAGLGGPITLGLGAVGGLLGLY